MTFHKCRSELASPIGSPLLVQKHGTAQLAYGAHTGEGLKGRLTGSLKGGASRGVSGEASRDGFKKRLKGGLKGRLKEGLRGGLRKSGRA